MPDLRVTCTTDHSAGDGARPSLPGRSASPRISPPYPPRPEKTHASSVLLVLPTAGSSLKVLGSEPYSENVGAQGPRTHFPRSTRDSSACVIPKIRLTRIRLASEKNWPSPVFAKVALRMLAMFLVLALALPRDSSAFGPVPLHFVRCQACRPASPAGKFERSPCPEHSECVPFDDERGCRLSRLQWRSAVLREWQLLNRLRRPRPPPPQTTRTGVQVNGKQRGEVSSNVRLESSGRRTRIPSTSRGAV